MLAHAMREADPPRQRLLQSRVPKAAAGLTLLDHLAQRFRYLDRAAWQRAIDRGEVTVDGQAATAGLRLRAGTTVAYRQPWREPWVDTGFQVLWTTADYAVVGKPAHLPMHADGPFAAHTLIQLLRRGPLPDARLVHRLDRETSGVCVVARNATAGRDLAHQFASGTTRKRYLAIVHGRVESDFAVAAPIGRSRSSAVAIRRSAAPDALAPQSAATDFRVLRTSADRSLVCCEPATGRTHQIRVHLEFAGHPLLGDKLYGQSDAAYLEFVARAKATHDARLAAGAGHGPDRHLLHAHWLEFREPRTQATVAFTAPWPADFARWLPDS